MRKNIQASLWGAAFAVLVALTYPQVMHAQGTWTDLAPLLLPTEGMQGSGSGNVNVGLYGYSFGDTNLTRRYKIAHNTWTLGTPGPLPVRSEIAYGDNEHGGFVYVIGGRSFTGVINNNDRYDPTTDTWQSMALMPTPRAAAASASLDDYIYVIGGRTSGGGPCTGGALSTVERYDIDHNTWTTVASYPVALSDIAAISHGGKIYAFGGCDSSGAASNLAFVYNPTKNMWSSVAPMPTPRGSLVAGIVGEVIYAIGGISGVFGTELSTNEAYNVTHNSWTEATPMPTPRSEAAVRSIGGRIYVYGGGAYGVSEMANEVFKPNP